MIPVTGNLQRKFDLPIIEVVAGSKVGVENEAFTDCATGKLVNSAFLTGMSVEEAKEAITEWLTKEGKDIKRSTSSFVIGYFHVKDIGASLFQSLSATIAAMFLFLKVSFL